MKHRVYYLAYVVQPTTLCCRETVRKTRESNAYRHELTKLVDLLLSSLLKSFYLLQSWFFVVSMTEN